MRSILKGLAAVLVVAAAAGAGAWYWLTGGGGELGYEQAADRLVGVVEQVTWSEDFVTRRARLQLGGAPDLKRTLPDIGQFPLTVAPAGGPGTVVAEIFASTEKAGSGTDGWLTEVAGAFNASGTRLADGRRAQVAVRRIPSGTGYEFIASGKYRPAAYSPSNALWVRMASAHGVTMTPVRERLVGNVAGVVMKRATAERLRSAHGGLGIRQLIDAVVRGDLVMGYTNPFASSTGLNFLVSVLATFGEGDEQRMLSADVVSAFEAFQANVPFVALTTLQMRESVERDGSLGAFVMEYQTFANSPALRSGYEFVPFGFRHDNPLYAVGRPEAAELETLERLAAFAETPHYRQLAAGHGFDPELEHTPDLALPSGQFLIQAQRLWKEKKDAGRPVSALFLADVSGSMAGTRLNALKAALLEGSEFISPGNSIGLAVFSDRVSVRLPVRPFDLGHRASFHAAVQDLQAEGNTAMYDGVAVALYLLVEERARRPESKPMVFVLSDGETNRGLGFEDLRRIIAGLGIPIYTIGYEADLQELGRLSSLVEAANLNAGEGEITYKIGSLLNAQM